MHKLVHFTHGTAWYYDKKGKQVPVNSAYMYVPSECDPKYICDKEVLRVKDPAASPKEWYEIDLVELAKTLAAPVVTKVTN